MVVVTDPAHFGPSMFELLGRKQPRQGMSGLGLRQVCFAKVLVSWSKPAQYKHDFLGTGIPQFCFPGPSEPTIGT